MHHNLKKQIEEEQKRGQEKYHRINEHRPVPVWANLCLEKFRCAAACTAFNDYRETRRRFVQIAGLLITAIEAMDKEYAGKPCGFVPPTPGYAPCTREYNHTGPCAHAMKDGTVPGGEAQ